MPNRPETGSSAARPSENPYEAPAPTRPAEDWGGVAGAPPFNSRRGLSRLNTGLIAAFAVLTAASVVSLALQLLVITQAEDPTAVERAWTYFTPVMQGIAFFATGLLLASGVTFALWFRQKHANLQALGAWDLAYTPRWAVASFFVPIANLVLPHRIGVEIWRASNPLLPLSDPTAWKREGRHGLVSWWWGLFLGVRLGEPLISHLFKDTQDPDDALLFIGLLLFLKAAWIGAAFVTLSFVRRLDARQELRYERLRIEGRRLFDPDDDPRDGSAGSATAQAVPIGPHCPACLAPFRHEDYRADAEHIFCSRCGAELPRGGEAAGGPG